MEIGLLPHNEGKEDYGQSLQVHGHLLVVPYPTALVNSKQLNKDRTSKNHPEWFKKTKTKTLRQSTNR